MLRRLAWIISSSSILRDVVNRIIIDDSDHTRRHVDSVDSDDSDKHDDKDNTKINSDNIYENHNLKDDDYDGSGGNDNSAKKLILYHRYSLTMIELHQIITGGNILFKASDIRKNKNNTDRNNKNWNHDDDDVNNNDDETLYTCINNINRTGVIVLNYLQACYNTYFFLLRKSQQFDAKITSYYTSQLVYNYLDVKEVIINEAMKIKNEFDIIKSNTILDMIFTEYHYVLIMSLCNNSRISRDDNKHIHRNDTDVKPIIHNNNDDNNHNDDDKFISVSINSHEYNYEDSMMKGMKEYDYIKNRHCDAVLTTHKYSNDNHSHNELSNKIIDTNNHDIINSTTDDDDDKNDVDYDIDDDDRKRQLFCWCRSNAEDGYEMIECDSCHEWFHFNCVGVDSNKLYSINCNGSNDKKMIMKKKMTSKHDDYCNNYNDEKDDENDHIASYKATTVYNKRNKVKEQIEIKKDNDDENELQYVCISCSVIQGREYLYRW